MFSSLNPQQKLAVQTIDHGCLVLAGAGSGKTRVLLKKIIYLLSTKRHAAEGILAITFTQQAANELKQRLIKEGQLKNLPVKEVFVGTFHAYALQVLRRYRKHLGAQSRLLLCAEPDKQQIINHLLGEKATSTKNLDQVEQISSQISFWKNHQIDPKEAQLTATEVLKFSAELYQRYQHHLEQFGWVDFEDLLQLTLKIFNEYPECLKEEQERCQYLLIDEFQDTNPLQWTIAHRLIAHRPFTFVGDDDQSIYGWRGANPKILQDVLEAYPTLTLIKLEKSYRCSIPIIDLANRVIQKNDHLFEKKLFSDKIGENIELVCVPDAESEADWVLEHIEERRKKHPYEQSAILYRSHHQRLVFKKACQEKKIECIIVGQDELFQRPEVRLMMDYWHVLSDRHSDASLLRIINAPKRGIGPNTLKKMVEWAQMRQKSFWETLISFGFITQLKSAEKEAVEKFIEWITVQQKKIWHLENSDEKGAWEEYLQRLLSDLSLNDYLSQGISEKFFFVRRQRIQKICALLLSKLRYSKTQKSPGGNFTLALNKLEPTHFEFNDKKFQKEKPVLLMTFHASKGLEFDSVYLCGLEKGILPHRNAISEMQIQEERRIFYVGLTRARIKLTLTYARFRKKCAQHLDSIPSPFLEDVLGQDVEEKVISSAMLSQARANIAQKYLSQLRSSLESTPSAQEKN